MVDEKRFRINFSGKNYPSWRPVSVIIFACDADEARKWAIGQLEAWGIRNPARVKLEISEEPPAQAPAQPPAHLAPESALAIALAKPAKKKAPNKQTKKPNVPKPRK